jgi:hypothetical protein
VFVRWSPDLARSMREEADRFIEGIFFGGDARLGTLLTSRQTFVDARLAELYGVVVPGPGWQHIDLPAAQRGGLLTQGWFLAANADPLAGSPTRRGSFVRQRLFCSEIPPPPANIPPAEPIDPSDTTRERTQRYLAQPACAACHQLMDPLGFAFERYDSIGSFRTTEKGKTVDSSSTITGTDVDGQPADALELEKVLARSGQVRGCVARSWFELAVGRRAVDEVDRCTLDELERTMKTSDGDLRALMLAVAGSVAFRTRPAAGVSGGSALPLITTPAGQLNVKKAILDFLATQLSQLGQRLTDPDDRARLDAHFSLVRELERMLQ